MPFPRPTLTALRQQVAADIASAIPGADALLRFSNLKVLGDVQAGLAFQHYGYLDYIALNAVPFTATGEFLEGWAALKSVFRLPATQASGVARATGTAGTLIPAGTVLVRGDGVQFKTSADATITDRSGAGLGISADLSITAVAEPSGLTGAFGNTDTGVILTLGQAIVGVGGRVPVVAAISGGADLESDDSLRNRMLLAYQSPPIIGGKNDYVNWALSVPGVTRAWCAPNGFGNGTVVVYIMLDVSEAAHAGFPQGTNGVAAAETRDTTAAGDQLIVANYIYTQQPVTALVYVVAPSQQLVNFTIAGIASASADIKAAIGAAIADVFYRTASPGGIVALSDIESAIAAVPGTAGFLVASPTSNISASTGALAVLGNITYT